MCQNRIYYADKAVQLKMFGGYNCSQAGWDIRLYGAQLFDIIVSFTGVSPGAEFASDPERGIIDQNDKEKECHAG